MSGWKKNKHGEWETRLPRGLAGHDVTVKVDGRDVSAKCELGSSFFGGVMPKDRRAFIVAAVCGVVSTAEYYNTVSDEDVRADGAALIEWAIALPKVPK
jgi:hypothetical protein